MKKTLLLKMVKNTSEALAMVLFVTAVVALRVAVLI